MNKFTRKRIISALTLCAMSVTTLMATSCGKPKDDKKKVAVITKQNISFWQDVQNGAEDAGKELGIEILYNEGGKTDYPQGDNDFSTQIEYINYAIDQKVDAIVIAPNGQTELNDAFDRASNAGIKIININSRANSDKVLSCISSSDADGGAVAARRAADAVLLSDTIRNGMSQLESVGAALKNAKSDEEAEAVKKQAINGIKNLGKGAVGIVGHTAATAENRINGFKTQSVTQISQQMTADGFDLTNLGLTQADAAGLFVNFFVEGERCSTIRSAYDEAKKLINANPNMVCMFATNTNTTIGVCQAVEELELRDKIFVIGFNSDEEEINYLKTKVLDCTIIQNPYNMGYVGVRYALKAANDEGFPAALDTGVTYVTAENLNDQYIQLLIYPENY